jgi:hypothetical protein
MKEKIKEIEYNFGVCGVWPRDTDSNGVACVECSEGFQHKKECTIFRNRLHDEAIRAQKDYLTKPYRENPYKNGPCIKPDMGKLITPFRGMKP